MKTQTVNSSPLHGTFGHAGEGRQRWYPPNVEERFQGLGYWTDELIGDAVRAHARRCPEKLALADSHTQVTYGQLEERVARMAAGWLSSGLGAGDRVVVQMANSVAFIEVFLSLQRMGAVPVMALPGHREHDLEAFLEISDAVAYVADMRGPGVDFRSIGDTLKAQCPGLRVVIHGVDSRQHVLLSALAEGPSKVESPVGVRSTDLALLQLSGGSTGTPKLIPRTHADYLYSIRESARICGLEPTSVYLCVLPAAHNFAVSSPGWLGVLHAGGTVVLASDASARTCLPMIQDHRVTITAVVPPVVILWLDAITASPCDLSSLEVIQVGGAKLPEQVARRIPDSFGCRLQQVFGMAEGLVSYTRVDDPDEKVFTTQGTPISEADEILVVDDEDRPVRPGQPGNLLTRGPYTIRGYLGSAECNMRSFTTDGFYRTGDVVRLLGRHIQVTGRAKDQINRGGEKIAPEEVENLLLSHPGVQEVCVVGVPDELLGERIQAHVVLRQGNEPDVAELRMHLKKQGIATFKMPDVFCFAATLPRTAVGKTAASRLRQL